MRETNRVREHPTCHIVMDPFLGIIALAQVSAVPAMNADRAALIFKFVVSEWHSAPDPLFF